MKGLCVSFYTYRGVLDVKREPIIRDEIMEASYFRDNVEMLLDSEWSYAESKNYCNQLTHGIRIVCVREG